MSQMCWFVVLLDFLFIGVLPIIFFRRDGQFNLKWWATGWPFFAVGLLFALALWGTVEPLHFWNEEIYFLPTFLAVKSIALMAYAMGSNRVALSLWHQKNDAPKEIVRHGAYQYIRHPFYTSFLIGFSAAVLAFPHPLTIFCLFYAAIVLNLTAAGEEKRLSQSEFGEQYRAYILQTGRFFPKLRLK